MRFFSRNCVFMLLLVPAIGAAMQLDSTWARLTRTVHLFPEYQISADIKYFALHKNQRFRERYFLESNIDLEFALFDVGRRFYQYIAFFERSGFGRQDEVVILDPRDIYYGVAPVSEYRIDGYLIRAGLDHDCLHEIDRKDPPTLYWNRFFLAGGTSTVRLSEFVDSATGGNRTWRNRLAWYAGYGYYVRNFFGVLSGEQLMSPVPDAEHELTGTVRVALWATPALVAALRTNAMVASRLGGGAFWSQETGLELHFRGGAFGGMIFVNYILDNRVFDYGQHEIVELSKDRLLEMGLQLYR